MYIETDVPESYISNVTANKDVKVEFPVLRKNNGCQNPTSW